MVKRPEFKDTDDMSEQVKRVMEKVLGNPDSTRAAHKRDGRILGHRKARPRYGYTVLLAREQEKMT